MNERDERQQKVAAWVRSTFGDHRLFSIPERVRRLVEEVIEVAQAEGMDPDAIKGIVDYVYGRPAGDPAQEAGGVGVTLLAYCTSRGFSAEQTEINEVDRVTKIDQATFRNRHQAKVDAGVAA